ncbi:MAG: hypothetical protein FD168_295 [Desulfobulbaceae bacterium]|nr:MAG: hypothetical protein FD168_295 [Desulfobulbaceae bacterium]
MVLADGGAGGDRAQQDKGKADPEREVAVKGFTLLRRQHKDKQAEAFNHEPKGHKGQAGAGPGKQGSLSGKKYAGIIEVGHEWYRRDDCEHTVSG